MERFPLSIGTVITGNGTVITPNGTVVTPDGGITNPGLANFTSNAATTTTFGTGVYAPITQPYWTTGMGFTEAGLGALTQPTLTQPIQEPYLEGNITYIPQPAAVTTPAPVATGVTQVITPVPVYVPQPVYPQQPVYMQQPTFYQQPMNVQQPATVQRSTGMG